MLYISELMAIWNEKYPEQAFKSKSTFYNYLKPKRKKSNESKRHHEGASVRVFRIESVRREYNPDQYHQFVAMKFLRKLVSLGSLASDSFIISADDKAQIYTDIPATQFRGRTLMLKRNVISATDHTFGPQKSSFSVTPSCYLQYSPNEKKPYKAIYCALRSNVYGSTNQVTHAEDIMDIFSLHKSEKSVHSFDLWKDDGSVKPVGIFFCDGGNDQNPSFFATRYTYGRMFQKYDFDLLIVICNSGGHSAFNPVERAMHPLTTLLCNKEYSSIPSGSETREDVSDRIVASIASLFSTCDWAGASYTTKSITKDYSSSWKDLSYQDIMEMKKDVDSASESFQKQLHHDDYHSITSKYMLLFKKCKDPSQCPTGTCRVHRSNINQVLPKGLPAPIMRDKSDTFMSFEETMNMKKDPLYDQHLPSIKGNREAYTCQYCSKYVCSKELLNIHSKNVCNLRYGPGISSSVAVVETESRIVMNESQGSLSRTINLISSGQMMLRNRREYKRGSLRECESSDEEDSSQASTLVVGNDCERGRTRHIEARRVWSFTPQPSKKKAIVMARSHSTPRSS